MNAKIKAEALIKKYADTKDADIRTLLTDARNAVRRGDYAAAVRHLSDNTIAYMKSREF